MAVSIENTILDYLESVLTVPVLKEIPPEGLTVPCVIIQKTGSGVDNKLYRATIALQSYGATRYEADQLNETVKEKMDDIISLDRITKSKLNSDYDFTDTTNKRYRYQAIYDINHY